MVRSAPTILMAMATTSASTMTKINLVRSVAGPRRRRDPRARRATAAAAKCRRARQRHGAAEEDPAQIRVVDGEDVAEQKAHQVHLGPAHEGCRDHAQRQRRVREKAQQGIEGHRLLASEHHQQARHGQRDEQHAGGEIERKGQTQRHADEGGLGHRLAEVGHAPPDHEPAQWRGDGGQAETREQGTHQEGFWHVS